MSPDSLYGRDLAPSIEAEITDFGVRIFTVRRTGAEQNYLRVSNFVMPNLCAVPAETGADGYNINWHVPIDDTHHWKYMFTFSRKAILDRETMRKHYLSEMGPNYQLIRQQDNRYLQNRDEMRSRTFTGLGGVFPVHDGYATESQGPIQDRTQEHLTSTDKAIVAARKLLLKAINDVQEGREAPHVIRDPKMNRFPHVQVLSEVLSSSINVKNHVNQIIKDKKRSSYESTMP